MNDYILQDLPELSRQTLIWLTVGLALLVVAAGCVFHLRRRGASRQTVRRVRQQFNGVAARALAANAYFYGMEKNWDSQWRGNGVLMLTARMLYFRLWRSNLDLSIPMARVEDVEVGHVKGAGFWPRRCLKVIYRGVDGHLRAARWLTYRPQDWVALIRENLAETIADGEEEAQEKHLS